MQLKQIGLNTKLLCIMLTIIISFFEKKINRRNNIDDKAFNVEKCRYCYEILFKEKLWHIHHLVRHYESEKEEPFHDKPLIIWRLGRLQFYKINYEPLKNDCNFFWSDSIIDQCLVNVKRKFIAGNAKMKIKCFFFLRKCTAWYWFGKCQILGNQCSNCPIF